MSAVINPTRIEAAEDEFCATLVATGDCVAAYRAAGYPLDDDKGNPLADTTILRRARATAKLPVIVARTQELQEQYKKGSGFGWSKEEVIDGYRQIYNTAMANMMCDQRNSLGETVGRKFNDKAATTAVTVLEHITRIYGFDAPVKVDGTVTFAWGASQAPAIDSSAPKTPEYDCIGEVAEPERATDDNAQSGTQSLNGMEQYAV